MANDKMTCAKCETLMRRVTRTKRVPVAGVEFEVTLPVYECPKDESWIVPPEAHREMDRQVLQTIATHGPATGKTLKFLRGALKMKATELAVLVNVVPETLSRWETEAKPVSPLVWVTVAAMALDKLANRSTTLKRLHAASLPTAPAQPIPLEVKVA